MNNTGITAELLTKFPVRKGRARKEAFRTWVMEKACEMGYEARVESRWNGVRCHNVVIGNPEEAQVLFTAHYDTPARMFLPNFITPTKPLIWLAYQVGMSLVMLAPAFIGSALAGWLASRSLGAETGFAVGYFVGMALMFLVLGLMMAGPANPSNANDNSSGVAAVLETMAMLPEEARHKAAFVLFDNEELGLLGSSAFASHHKKIRKEKLLVNMDCVGDGEAMLLLAGKAVRQLPEYARLEAALEQQQGCELVKCRMEKCVYPSDQKSFKRGLALCACRKGPRVGYCCSRIHTSRDVNCSQTNVDYLARGLTAFVAEL